MAVIVHNEAASRFEAHDGGKTAFLQYRLQSNQMIMVHTEVPPELGGLGIAGQLAAAALNFARREGRTVIPNCPFVAGYIKRHPEYLDLVTPAFRARVSGP